MSAIENINRIVAAAYGMGFALSRSSINDETSETELVRQTSRGRLTLSIQSCPSNHWTPHSGCLQWTPDNEACTDFSVLAFDLVGDRNDLARIEQFEAEVASTLAFHKDTLIKG